MPRHTLLLASGLLATVPCFAQPATYQGLSVIRAATDRADYRVEQEWVRGSWRIAPEAHPDVLVIPVLRTHATVLFRTDQDSIRFTLRPGERQSFYVLLSGQRYALTELKGETLRFEPVRYEQPARAPRTAIRYELDPANEYSARLRREYSLDAVVAGARTDAERALRMVHWVHQQWRHNGSNQPRKSDALSILAEARQGGQFRCVEYGIVASSALNAIGLPSRVLALKTKDVETTQSGAGHVLLETWLPDQSKWVLLDGQWDVMPVLRGKPLNAVEFQSAIAGDYDALEIRSLSGTGKLGYVSWIYPYLYYLDVSLDNREGELPDRAQLNGKSKLMLVPAGAKNPTVFQQKWPITNCFYTHSLADFYAPPTAARVPAGRQ